MVDSVKIGQSGTEIEINDNVDNYVLIRDGFSYAEIWETSLAHPRGGTTRIGRSTLYEVHFQFELFVRGGTGFSYQVALNNLAALRTKLNLAPTTASTATPVRYVESLAGQSSPTTYTILHGICEITDRSTIQEGNIRTKVALICRPPS